jgi:hypothetical protein
MRPASTASAGSSAARDRRPRATTSSSRAGSPRRCTRSVREPVTGAPRWWPATARTGFASIPPPASCASQTTASWSPTGLSSSPRSSLRQIAPGAWPAEGSLLLDHLPFRVRALDGAGRRIPAGRVAFDVFCAVGYVAGKPRLWRAEAFSTARPANWSAFLASLPGEPKRIVCDAHGGMLQAVSERWPETELHQCEWHLQHALERLLGKETRRNPSGELDVLRARAEGALSGPSFRRPFVRAARAA